MGIQLTPTTLDGVYEILPFHATDSRGSFTKYISSSIFKQHNLAYTFEESYMSVSHQDVIRGMHFQSPPQDHEKVVYVTHGAILDVVLDIRKASPTYGKHLCFLLNEHSKKGLYIPKGFAHGFKSLENNTTVVYHQTTSHSPLHDKGILWSSFGVNWDSVSPLISPRDSTFPLLQEFISPF